MNAESYPATLFPLRGDVSAEAGATVVKVIGLQGLLLGANPLTDGGVPTYIAANGDIEWQAGSGSVVRVNGIGVSADYVILMDTAIVINYGLDNFLGVRVNGVQDGG